jgi:Icc-related predicted phosphoesterase
MNSCFFVSDLHGKMSRYEALFRIIKKDKPDFVFIGGDLLPHRSFKNTNVTGEDNFFTDFLAKKLSTLRDKLDCNYPEIFLIPGNDDYKSDFIAAAEGEKEGLWRNIHNQCVAIGKYRLYGYACVPPTPFRNKDWDRYDISKVVAPGCIAPPDGYHSMPPAHDPENDTIQQDILKLVNEDAPEYGIFLFHSPPFDTSLDLAETGFGIYQHVGSKAIRNFIETRKPYFTMHGHIHESARISGEWKQTIGRTIAVSAAHDGPDLVLVKFELHNVHSAIRTIIHA